MTRKIDFNARKRAREALAASQAVLDAKAEIKRQNRAKKTKEKLISIGAEVASAVNSRAILRRLRLEQSDTMGEIQDRRQLARVQKAQKRTQKRNNKEMKSMSKESRRIREAILGA